jgi:hypothetical protein
MFATTLAFVALTGGCEPINFDLPAAMAVEAPQQDNAPRRSPPPPPGGGTPEPGLLFLLVGGGLGYGALKLARRNKAKTEAS